MAIAEWFCGEAGQKIMCASNDYEEASLVFDCIDNFREESRAMSKVTRKNVKGIFFGNPKQRKKTGKFSAQNKGTIKKMSARASAKEGRNLKTVIVDEVHEMKDASTVLPLKSSISTQDEPLYFEITTEGIVRDGYLDERLKELRKILRGEDERPYVLIWLYTQDSEAEVWNDPSSWQKSNPLLGVCKKVSYLRNAVEEAAQSGAKRAFTLAKEFNIKQLAAAAWLRETDIIGCNGTFNIEDFKGTKCIIGVDLAETNDLCAVTFLFMRPNDDVKYLHTMYFVTEVKANDDTATDSPTNVEKKNYRQWEREGLCRIVKGNVIDDDVVANYLHEMYDQYEIIPLAVGYDEWHAKEFAKITKQTFGDVLTKIRMSYDALNTPMITLERDLYARHINYNNNAMCAWCFRNTAIKHDKNGFVMPEKIGGYIGNKIDGTMSKIIAYAALRECKNEFMNIIRGGL
jgi:phage terminase large subunit-like protein